MSAMIACGFLGLFFGLMIAEPLLRLEKKLLEDNTPWPPIV